MAERKPGGRERGQEGDSVRETEGEREKQRERDREKKRGGRESLGVERKGKKERQGEMK